MTSRRPLGSFLFLAGSFLLSNIALAQTVTEEGTRIDKRVDRLGPYTLGTEYEKLKDLPGFKLDDKRTKPEEDIVAGKIIDKRVLGVPTIQRLIFKHGKLCRISIIIGPQDWTEERAKDWVTREGWGDPVEKTWKDGQEKRYCWLFQSTLGLILPADGGRWMASIAVKD